VSNVPRFMGARSRKAVSGMAFGKKKNETAAPAPVPAAPDDGLEVSGALFTGEPAAEEEDPIAAGLLAEEKAEAAKDPFAGDLLNMFQTTQIEQDDRSILLALAGEVEIDDLLEDLQTTGAAMGCDAATEEAYAA
jgi:hypothetical protein